jgi:hypothetical protein
MNPLRLFVPAIVVGVCGGRVAPAGAARDARVATTRESAVRANAPRVFALRADALEATRTRVRAGDKALAPAYDKLLRDAGKALGAPIVAVTDKHTLLPPTGDRHDYYSLSPYWWPDPSKSDGLPYIRRDGETNPESKKDLDQPRVAQMGGNVQTLALAYYLSGDEKYAARAAQQLRTWFLDPATRMNPHLRFAQLVRGNPAERGSGIIDTRWFVETADAVGLLGGSQSWTAADQQGMQEWMRQYATWLWTSKNGQTEHKARNNHGSWYAAQVATLSMFAGDTAVAHQLVLEAKPRIGWQITPAGEQPIEMERTKSLHYSGFNIEALSRLANVGHHFGVDLWAYQAPEGGSLRKAVDHIAPYVVDPKAWPGQEIGETSLDEMLLILRRAQFALGAPVYAPVIAKLPAREVAEDRSALLYPDAAR